MSKNVKVETPQPEGDEKPGLKGGCALVVFGAMVCVIIYIVYLACSL